MSAYITLNTPMLDQECLLAALEELGFDRFKVEIHDEPAHLVGYRGDKRVQTSHVIIRRRFVGGSSNDIGFELTPTGYRAHVSGYDHPRFGDGWLNRLSEAYARLDQQRLARLAEAERQRVAVERRRLVEAQRLEVHAKAKKLGYRVEETRQGETIRMVLVKRVY